MERVYDNKCFLALESSSDFYIAVQVQNLHYHLHDRYYCVCGSCTSVLCLPFRLILSICSPLPIGGSETHHAFPQSQRISIPFASPSSVPPSCLDEQNCSSLRSVSSSTTCSRSLDAHTCCARLRTLWTLRCWSRYLLHSNGATGTLCHLSACLCPRLSLSSSHLSHPHYRRPLPFHSRFHPSLPLVTLSSSLPLFTSRGWRVRMWSMRRSLCTYTHASCLTAHYKFIGAIFWNR